MFFILIFFTLLCSHHIPLILLFLSLGKQCDIVNRQMRNQVGLCVVAISIWAIHEKGGGKSPLFLGGHSLSFFFSNPKEAVVHMQEKKEAGGLQREKNKEASLYERSLSLYSCSKQM